MKTNLSQSPHMGTRLYRRLLCPKKVVGMADHLSSESTNEEIEENTIEKKYSTKNKDNKNE